MFWHLPPPPTHRVLNPTLRCKQQTALIFVKAHTDDATYFSEAHADNSSFLVVVLHHTQPRCLSFTSQRDGLVVDALIVSKSLCRQQCFSFKNTLVSSKMLEQSPHGLKNKTYRDSWQTRQFLMAKAAKCVTYGPYISIQWRCYQTYCLCATAHVFFSDRILAENDNSLGNSSGS